jgi:hypothetical protein
MWLTGFDAPSCSTIYLDKPMKNHTLMQTIARANRVCDDKEGRQVGARFCRARTRRMFRRLVRPIRRSS